jgi:hypothetical protein
VSAAYNESKMSTSHTDLDNAKSGPKSKKSQVKNGYEVEVVVVGPEEKKILQDHNRGSKIS